MKILRCVSKFTLLTKVLIIAAIAVFLPAMGQAKRVAQPNPIPETVKQAGIQYACALLDMMAYKSQLNEVIRDVVSDFGYDIVYYQNKGEKADTNFILLRSKEPDEVTGNYLNIVAVPGTEKKKDMEVDLRLHKVLFGGANPTEFAEFAKTENTTSAQPLVHSGFNDYTQTAFFTPRQDGTLGVDPLMNIIYDEDDELLLTGHSLGGAVAVLLGTRMECMGIPPGKIQVITFGAPAVGNKAFADEYGSLVQHTRFTMGGDPVKGLLQMLNAGYVQTGEEVKLKRNANSRKFSHNMSEYMDASLRNYMDVLNAEGLDLHNHVDENSAAGGFSVVKQPVKNRVYLAPAVVHLPDDIDNDTKYMAQLTELMEGYDAAESVKGDRTDEQGQNAAAIKTQCDRICRVSIEAKLISSKAYQVTVHEDFTDPYGNIMSTKTCGTTTDNLSPIEAVFYSLGRCMASRASLE